MKESEKAKDPRYILNPTTGRYVLKDGKIGKKVVSGNTKSSKGSSSPFSDVDVPQLNPKNLIAQLNPEVVPPQSFQDSGVEEALEELNQAKKLKVKQAQDKLTKELMEQKKAPQADKKPVMVPKEVVQPESIEEYDEQRTNVSDWESEITPLESLVPENEVEYLKLIAHEVGAGSDDYEFFKEQSRKVTDLNVLKEIWEEYIIGLIANYPQHEVFNKYLRAVDETFKGDLVKSQAVNSLLGSGTINNLFKLKREGENRGVETKQLVKMIYKKYDKLEEGSDFSMDDIESILNTNVSKSTSSESSSSESSSVSNIVTASMIENNIGGDADPEVPEVEGGQVDDVVGGEPISDPAPSDSTIIGSKPETHPVKYWPFQIKLLFGTSEGDIPWDKELENNVFESDISKSELVAFMDALIMEYGNRILVEDRKTETKEEFHEIIQMVYCVMRNLQRGTRAPMAMVPVSSLMGFAKKLQEPAPPAPPINEEDNLYYESVSQAGGEEPQSVSAVPQAEQVPVSGNRFNIPINKAQDKLSKAYHNKRTDGYGKPIIRDSIAVQTKITNTPLDGPGNKRDPLGFYKQIQFKIKATH